MRKVKIIGIISLLLLIIILSHIRSENKGEQYYESLREIEESTEETKTIKKPIKLIDETVKEETVVEETQEMKSAELSGYQHSKTVDFDKYYNMNSDYVCWITIPDTKIDYPVVFADSEYYLHRSFDKKELYAGTLFIDPYSTKGLDQNNLIIYGHNMKNGSMFGTLKNFKNKDYFDKHPYIEIYTKDEIRIYQIFSVREVSSDINTLNYALDNFDKKEYIEKAIEQSVQSRTIDSDNQILSLSTCVGDTSKRLLISAIRVN